MMQPRLCKFCGKLFTPEKYGQRRQYCYDEKCIQKKKQETIGLKVEQFEIFYKKKKERLKNQKLCSCCGIRPIAEGNRFLCYTCWYSNRETNGTL